MSIMVDALYGFEDFSINVLARNTVKCYERWSIHYLMIAMGHSVELNGEVHIGDIAHYGSLSVIFDLTLSSGNQNDLIQCSVSFKANTLS